MILLLSRLTILIVAMMIVIMAISACVFFLACNFDFLVFYLLLSFKGNNFIIVKRNQTENTNTSSTTSTTSTTQTTTTINKFFRKIMSLTTAEKSGLLTTNRYYRWRTTRGRGSLYRFSTYNYDDDLMNDFGSDLYINRKYTTTTTIS